MPLIGNPTHTHNPSIPAGARCEPLPPPLLSCESGWEPHLPLYSGPWMFISSLVFCGSFWFHESPGS